MRVAPRTLNDDMDDTYCMEIFQAERRAHAPLVAAAEVANGVEVVTKENHLNRTATSGCVALLVRFLVISRGMLP